MEYPGNAALPADIKDRIASTFQQTLDSARQGRSNEALLGCDFILKLDPEFKPARDLIRKLEGASAPPPKADAGAEIEALVRARRFKEALDLGRANSALVASDPAVAGLLARAQDLVEASPYVSSFLDSAQEALEAGDEEKAAAVLDKARALDPEHPRLAAISKKLAVSRPSASAPPPEASESGSSSFALDFDEPVTSFRLDGGPDRDLGRGLGGGPLESAPSPELDPGSDLPDLPGEADDPLASLGEVPDIPSPSPTPSEDLEELPDLFADFESLPGPSRAPADDAAADDPLGTEFLDTAPAAGEQSPFGGGSADDDPLAFGSLSPDGGDLELGDDEVEGDPFALLPTDDPPEGDAPAEGGIAGFGLAAGDAGGASAETGGGDRVQDLLADGQAAFDRGDPQGAIDAWSRIFLIDIDNEEASRRIERARNLKAESERAVEEVYHEGLDAWQAADKEKAQKAFERVLELQPGHSAAREQLDQLLAGGESPGAPSGDDLGAGIPAAAAPPAREDLLEEILIPPAPGETAASALGPPPPQLEPLAKAGRSKGGGSRYLIAGLAVLVAVLAGGWYLFSNRSSLFPNNESEQAAGAETPRLNSVQRAEKLYASGRKEQAIAQLKRVPASSSHHQRAQELIAEWSLAEAEAEPTLDPALEARRQELVARAQSFAESGEFLRARAALNAAAKVDPLNAGERALLASVGDHLQPLEGVLRLIEDREWSFALPDLWREQVKDPENRDVVRLIVDCYYNLGVRELQRGNQSKAVENFQEAVKLSPEDPELARHLDFSQTYLNRSEDLLYRIYVKYLPYRTT